MHHVSQKGPPFGDSVGSTWVDPIPIFRSGHGPWGMASHSTETAPVVLPWCRLAPSHKMGSPWEPLLESKKHVVLFFVLYYLMNFFSFPGSENLNILPIVPTNHWNFRGSHIEIPVFQHRYQPPKGWFSLLTYVGKSCRV